MFKYVKFSLFLGIYPGTLSCIVKLLDEVGVSHMNCVGDNKTIKFYNLRS